MKKLKQGMLQNDNGDVVILNHRNEPIAFDNKGQPIALTKFEMAHASWMQKQVNEKQKSIPNSLGYEIPITTLTTIMKRITEQKFFEIAPADYFAVKVGEGAFSTFLTTYRSFDVAAPFETGIINTNTNNGRVANVETGIDALNIAVKNWAKGIGWNIIDLEQAARSGNWDLVTSKEKARKRNWDLGIQKVAFLGVEGDSAVNGFYGQTSAGVSVNSSVITKALKDMSTTELKAFTAAIITAYRDNCQGTAWPEVFTIPESDYTGLATTVSPDFPIKSVLTLLRETFEEIVPNKKFKILPCRYGDNAYSGLGVQRYVLSRIDEESLVMNVPVAYTNTLANSLDSFNFQNIAYGQFTGVLALRPSEMLYFDYVV